MIGWNKFGEQRMGNSFVGQGASATSSLTMAESFIDFTGSIGFICYEQRKVNPQLWKNRT